MSNWFKNSRRILCVITLTGIPDNTPKPEFQYESLSGNTDSVNIFQLAGFHRLTDAIPSGDRCLPKFFSQKAPIAKTLNNSKHTLIQNFW